MPKVEQYLIVYTRPDERWPLEYYLHCHDRGVYEGTLEYLEGREDLKVLSAGELMVHTTVESAIESIEGWHPK